jgi:putative acetyltransferase
MAPRRVGAALVELRPRRGALPHGFAVRPRARCDNEALMRLFNQESFQRFGTTLEPFDSPDAVQAWIDGNGPGNFELVGTVEAAVVAFAGLYPLHGRRSHAGSISLCVHEPLQGRGIGTALLRLILASADLLAGLRRLQLEVLANNRRAVALYEAFGFRIEGRHESFARRGDAYVDAFTMARVVPEALAVRTGADMIALVERLRAPSLDGAGILSA